MTYAVFISKCKFISCRNTVWLMGRGWPRVGPGARWEGDEEEEGGDFIFCVYIFVNSSLSLF